MKSSVKPFAASQEIQSLQLFNFDYNDVDSPVSKWSNDGVSGQSYFEGAAPIRDVLEKKYGKKIWMHPRENIDRFRMCDAGE